MKLRQLMLTGGFLLAGLSAAMADPATGAAITAAIGGNTVEGNMDSSGAYAEFYETGGVIKGDGYTGKWSVDGDTMCFEYEGTPKDCWSVEIDGDQVRWLKDGKSGGTGTIHAGNSKNF